MKHPHFMAVSVLTDQVNFIDIHYGSRKVPPEGSWINQPHMDYANFVPYSIGVRHQQVGRSELYAVTFVLTNQRSNRHFF